MDRELLKEALVKRAKKTYPISRFLTSPRAGAGVGAAYGGLAALLLGSGGAALPLIAGGAGVGYGMSRLSRWIESRALASRILKKDPRLMPTEKLTEEAIKKSAARFPVSEALTSRGFHAGVNASLDLLRAAATGNPFFAAMAPVSAGVGAGSTHLRRTIVARGMRGRLARGGKGLYESEKKLFKEIKDEHRKEVAKRVAKRVAVGAGAAGAIVAGSKAVKALAAED